MASTLPPPVPAVEQFVVEVQEQQVAQERSELRSPSASEGKPTFFREMLDDLDEPIPSTEQLERFGLFDVSASNRLLAEYRSAHPSPVSPTHFSSGASSPVVSPPSPDLVRRPAEPQQRHSLAVLPSQARYDDSSTPSPSSPVSSPRLNPFAFVRKATIRPRPSQRAKSTGDVVAPPPPMPTPALGEVQSFFSESLGPEASTSRGSLSLSRNDTVKENRAPRKLRKNAPPKITVRTDDDYLLRPFSSPVSAPPTEIPSSSSSPRPAPIRRPSGRSHSSSLATSPVSYSFSDAPPHPPSPTSGFPASVRREGALPPIEAKKRGSSTTSSMDDYLADSERAARLSPRASRGRFSVAVPGSPTGSSSSGGVWGKLRLGGKKSSSRPSSIASVDSGSTWDLVDGSGIPDSARSFEVMGRPASRPAVERSVSDFSIRSTASSLSGVEAAALPVSPSSPNLSRILEHPRESDKRSSVGSTSSSFRTPASGASTPAGVSAASSMTMMPTVTGEESGLTRSNPSSNLHLASYPSHSSLRSHPPSPLAPLSPSHLQPTAIVANPAATSALSLASTSYHSSRSSAASHSRDSLFYSGGEDTPASSAELNDEDGEGTGLSSAQEDDEDEAAPVKETLPAQIAKLVIGGEGSGAVGLAA
ncbi:hypothetical protein JCM8097_007631 [Rhodosporidiobolus ruineniae]